MRLPMTLPGARATLACAALPLLAAFPARGDMFNNKIILVGDKGAALGGAFTGLADDATATFYNPAGMTQLKNIKLNVSAQIVQFQKQEIQIAEGKIIPYNSFNFSPSITSFSQRMGKWAYGFSIVTPQNDLFRGEQELEAQYRDVYDSLPCYTDPGSVACYTKLNLSYSDVSKVTMIGPSGAMKFDDNISLGATLYGIHYTQLERTAYGGYDANYVEGNPDDLSRFNENLITRSVSQTGLGVTGTFGVLVRMDQGFSFGVNVSPGSLVWIDRNEEQRVEVMANTRLVDGDTSSKVPTEAFLYTLKEDGSHTEVTAPRLSLGASWRPIPSLLVTAQTDWLMGSLYTYNGFTTPDINEAGRSGFEYLKSEPAEYTLEKKSVVNFSGGVDLRLTKEYSAAIGGYTDFSQGPYDERPSSWDRRIDYFGGTLSVGIEKQYTESRFGVNFAQGRASITHFQWRINEGGQPEIESDEKGPVRTRRDFDSYNVGIFLSSTLKI